jgi:aminoglycoside 6'-N-acetyltransferase I
MGIREACSTDLEAWVALRHALWPANGIQALRPEAERILSSPDEVCFLLVESSVGTVGLVEATVHPGVGRSCTHIEGWYVDPRHRRQGHGRDLLERVTLWSLHRAISVLTSEVEPEIREDGRLRVETDRHILGLFALDAWREALMDVGFTVYKEKYVEGERRHVTFACLRPV